MNAICPDLYFAATILVFLLVTNPTIKRARLNFKFKRSASAQVSQASVFKSLSSYELLNNYVW